jgi:hypothetical protein
MSRETLAKEAVEGWHARAMDHAGRIVSSAEVILRLLTDYAELPSVSDEVQDALLDLRLILETHKTMTGRLNAIAHIRGLEVAAEALSAVPGAGDSSEEDEQR